MRHEQSAAASASVVSREDAAVHHLGHQQLVVVAEPGDELALGEELAVLHRAEALEHLDHAAGTPASRRCGRRRASPASGRAGAPAPSSPFQACSQRLWEPHGQRWHSMAASAPSGPVAPLALDQLGHREARHLLGEPAGAALPVARHVQRRRLPEHALDVAFLHLHGAAVGQQHAGRASRWRRRSTPHDEPEGWPRSCAAPARGARAPRRPRSARARPPRPRAIRAASTSARAVAVAADAREVAAGRVESCGASATAISRLAHLGLERRGSASGSGTGRTRTRRCAGSSPGRCRVESRSATEP